MLSIVKRECCAPGQPLVVSIDGVDELVRTHPVADSERPDLLKYLAGPEIGGGSFLSDTSPEEKAAELRAQPEEHYKLLSAGESR